MSKPSIDQEADWFELERKRIQRRRDVLNGANDEAAINGEPNTLTTALALSGGGIRSATYSLGMLQAFAKADVLKEFDYLSTVSGGGYTGGFLCTLLMPTGTRNGGAAGKEGRSPAPEELKAAFNDGMRKLTAVERRSDDVALPGVNPIPWLRSSGRYLAPNGGGDVWFAFTLWVRNLLAVHYVLGLALVGLLAVAGVINHLACVHVGNFIQEPGLSQVTTIPPFLVPGLLYGVLACIVLILAVLPLGVAYWYTQMPKAKCRNWIAGLCTETALIGSLLGILGGAFAWIYWPTWPRSLLRESAAWQYAGVVAGVVLACTYLWYLLAYLLTSFSDGAARPSAWMQVTRSRLTRYLSFALGGFIFLFATGLVLIASRQLADWIATVSVPGLTAAPFLAVLLSIWKLFSDKKEASGTKPLAVQWLPLCAVIVLVVLLVLTWGTVAAWLIGPTPEKVNYYAVLGVFLLALMTGEAFQFLNLSTIQNLYTARIVRAYLGATNAARSLVSRGQDMTEPHALDDMSLTRYYGKVCKEEVQLPSLAPVHLINVTINQTVAPQGSLVDQDRKGLAMCITPDGYLIDGKFSRRPQDDTNSPKFEPLSLGRWLGISGAAFGPGLGRGTRPERALLMVFANVRLGYWWKASLDPKPRRKGPFSTQMHLYREMRASFRGTDDSHWYVSDGGHFENTGVYELLRRRVDLILSLDNGADKGYQYEDMANLIRLASVDFGAVFKPITPAALALALRDYPEINLQAIISQPGGVASQASEEGRFVSAYRVTLPATDTFPEHISVLLSVKPRITPGSALDILQYHATHLTFPQESTSDQFFDDQQWESYRKLGRDAGDMLCANLLCLRPELDSLTADLKIEKH